MSAVFLDTGYLVALETSGDQHHAAASFHWRSFAPSRPRLVTTTFVVSEVVTFFNSRGRHAKAVEVGNRLLASPSVEVVHVDGDLFEAAWTLFRDRPDKRFSLPDCVFFVVMERGGISDALAFDVHFEQAGFRRLPLRLS